MSSSHKCAGSLFQMRGPASAKLLSPNVSICQLMLQNFLNYIKGKDKGSV